MCMNGSFGSRRVFVFHSVQPHRIFHPGGTDNELRYVESERNQKLVLAVSMRSSTTRPSSLMVTDSVPNFGALIESERFASYPTQVMETYCFSIINASTS